MAQYLLRNGPMNAVSSNTLIFVLGMHRSGTSALCAALSASGVSFGDHLLQAMAGVNEEGFWEDAGVVALNEQLLARTGSAWYVRATSLGEWDSAEYSDLRESAKGLLARGFGDKPLQAVKDPRFCLTLPFWLACCDELGIATRVSVIGRAPLEVARSLEKRDGFPLGYGLRLYRFYRGCIARNVPADSIYVRFDELLQDSPGVMSVLANELPLNGDHQSVAGAVRNELRHQAVATQAADDLLSQPDGGSIDLQALDRQIEEHWPVELTLDEFASRFTLRGHQLTELGVAHSAALATVDQRDRDIEALSGEHRNALATVDQRDADIASLSAEHKAALATIDERDEQIREFDRRLSQLGEEHSHALQTLRERDAELAWIKQRLDIVSKVPGVGYLIRRLRKNAQG